jgi:RNA polymerase sigma-70 factor (ECF subfamily)
MLGTLKMLDAHRYEGQGGLIEDCGWSGFWTECTSLYARHLLWLGEGRKTANLRSVIANHSPPAFRLRLCVFFAGGFVYRIRMSAANCWYVNSALQDMETETQAIARGLRRRDPEILDGLIEQYHYRLLRYLFYLTGQRETAEDLFQETWIRVLERGRQYDGKSRFEPWLFTIARNLVIDHQRRRQPRYVDLLDGQRPEDGGTELPAADEPAALELIARREEREQVHAGLSQLPAPYREVLVLRFQEELALEEIAEVVAAPLSTVKSRLYRGLHAMRRVLQGGNA